MLTGGDVDECEFELRAELRQVLTNIHVELRRGSVSDLRELGWVCAYLPGAGGILRVVTRKRNSRRNLLGLAFAATSAKRTSPVNK